MPNPFTVAGTNDSFTFNGPVKEIEVGAATSTFNCQYVYSFWKQWTSEGNAQYLPAWRPVGGDQLGGGNKVAFYAFLSNGWRVRIPVGLSDLFVTGGTFDPRLKVVAVGLQTGQFAQATATLTRTKSQSITVTGPLERVYSDPA